jgi:hypothetical protein
MHASTNENKKRNLSDISPLKSKNYREFFSDKFYDLFSHLKFMLAF